MAGAHVLQYVAADIEHDESFIAPARIHSRLSLRITAEVAHRDAVSVIAQVAIVAPKLAAIVIPQRISDGNLVAAVIHVDWVWIVSRLTIASPQQLEIVTENPEVLVAILNQDLVAPFIAGQVHKRD
jgi:hypothetical protein